MRAVPLTCAQWPDGCMGLPTRLGSQITTVHLTLVHGTGQHSYWCLHWIPMEFVPSVILKRRYLQRSSVVTDYRGHCLTLFPVREIKLNSQHMCMSSLMLNYSSGQGFEPRRVHVQSPKYNAYHVKPWKHSCCVILCYAVFLKWQKLETDSCLLAKVCKFLDCERVIGVL